METRESSRNAYGSIPRKHIIEGILRHKECLAPIFGILKNSFEGFTNLKYGTTQGKKSYSRWLMGYTKETPSQVSIVSAVENLPDALDWIHTKLSKKGLKMNMTKTTILVPEQHVQSTKRALKGTLVPDVDKIAVTSEGTILLGGFIGIRSCPNFQSTSERYVTDRFHEILDYCARAFGKCAASRALPSRGE